jgi:hypothetical protein
METSSSVLKNRLHGFPSLPGQPNGQAASGLGLRVPIFLNVDY